MLRPQNVVDADDVLVAEAQQDLDLAQRALAVGLVLERADLLDGDALVRRVIQGRTGRVGGNTQQVSDYTPHHLQRRSLSFAGCKAAKMYCCLAIEIFWVAFFFF